MPKRKPTTKITMAMPDALLEMADFLSDGLGVDRYDVIKMAIANGLALMEVQRQSFAGKLAQEGQSMATALGDHTALAEKVGANADEAMAAHKRKKKAAAAPVVEPEPELEPARIGFRSRNELDELDELEVIGSPLVAADVPMWTGYMKGL